MSLRSPINARRFASVACACLLPALTAAAAGDWLFQKSTTQQTPGSSLSKLAPEPPRDIPLIEKKWDELPERGRELSEIAARALELDREKWRHAETPNFVLNYRRESEARKVAREVEYDLWFVATTLRAGPERYERKSHVFIFEDEEEWKKFVAMMPGVPPWSSSFAHGDELFLNVRNTAGASFDSRTLAHEATHAIVARLFPRTRWPLWLNEGFAEYMASAGVAARKGQSVKRHSSVLRNADMPLEKMFELEDYPRDREDVARFYDTAEKLVRFLNTDAPSENFPAFIAAILGGAKFYDALADVYGDRYRTREIFERKFARFTR